MEINENKYNQRVRQAISDEYVRSSKQKRENIEEYHNICQRLANRKNEIPYSEYMNLKGRAEFLRRTVEELQIEIDTWDKAREICLNIAEEMKWQTTD